MNILLTWIQENTLLVSVIAGVSMLMLLITVLATPWIVAQLPDTYLQSQQSKTQSIGIARVLLTTGRACLGLVLIVLGLIMMVTPGPGIVTLLLGISVAEFPGKHRVLINLATRPGVFRSLNWMRKRHGKPPFEYPPSTL